MTAAQHALAEGDYALAAQRLVYARDAEPRNTAVLRLMTLAFWQAGDLPAAGARRARLGARRGRPAGAAPLRRAHLRGHGRASTSPSRRPTAPRRARPQDADAWERLGRLRLRLIDRAARDRRRSSARARSAPSVEGLLDLALAHHLAGDVGAEVTACEQATLLDARRRRPAWARYAHALARTDRVSDAIAACERALDARATTPRSPTCSSACAPRCRACCPPRDRLGLRPRGAGPAAGGRRAGAAEPGRPTSSSPWCDWEDLRALEGLSGCAWCRPSPPAWTGSSIACPKA